MIQCVLRVPLFVVPVLTGRCGFVAASIPPKGGTTNFRLKVVLQTSA